MSNEICQLYCPKCGEESERLSEGYCEDCLEKMQSELMRNNFAFDEWEKLSDFERNSRIKNTEKLY